MRINLFLFVFFIFNFSFAQKNTNVWHFGNQAGLDFNTLQSVTSANLGVVDKVPIPIKGPFNTIEGCFSIADKKTGKLLMSSDGSTVFNKNGLPMLNGTGLKGDPSSTSSGIVIPYPGNSKKYYVITVGATSAGGMTPGIHYSIVDMTLDGGLGGVTSQKNIPLSLGTSGYTQAHAGENIVAVQHQNGRDFWLLTRFRKVILVWAITSTGISEPVVYDNLADIGAHFAQGLGYFKFNIDGTKFIHADHPYANYSTTRLTIGDFDRQTGVVSNIKQRLTPELYNPYSLEFSPNSEYVYFTSWESMSYNGLLMAKMSDIENLSQTIPITKLLPNAVITCVQMAADGRIYAISVGTRNLYIITNPDLGDGKVAYLPNYLLPGTAGMMGLPIFAISFFKLSPVIGKSIVCTGISNPYAINIKLEGTTSLTRLKWDFGDGTVIRQTLLPGSASGRYEYMHSYQKAGVYKVTVTPGFDDGDGVIYEDPDKVSSSDFNVLDCKVVTNKMIRVNVEPD